MRWPWSRIRGMRSDAQEALATSDRQFATASKDHESALVIGNELRDIRAKNHLAQAIEFQLRGAQHA